MVLYPWEGLCVCERVLYIKQPGSLCALELFDDPCEECSKKTYRYKCSETGMQRVYSPDRKSSVPGASKEGRE